MGSCTIARVDTEDTTLDFSSNAPTAHRYLSHEESTGVVCWKCGGSGSLLVKKTRSTRPRGTSSTSPRVRIPAGSRDCGPCSGTGRKPPSKLGPPKKKPSVRMFKPTSGWEPRGPKSRGSPHDPEWAPGQGEMLISLAGHWGLYQLESAHRTTSDDVLTAAIALDHVTKLYETEVKIPVRYLDIGTGLGSVLGMVSWGLLSDHTSRISLKAAAGIEAQTTHVMLARRTASYNDTLTHTTIVHGDLRDLAAGNLDILPGPRNSYDIVTGTPPYFPATHGSLPTDPSRGMCAFELRGGIEVYMEAAVIALARQARSRFVLCQTGREIPRTERAARDVGLDVLARWDIWGRTNHGGHVPLFCVFVCGWAEFGETVEAPRTVCVRDDEGQFTSEMLRLMDLVGKPTPCA
ncbi:hypothetical protein HKX48_004716 [Thoreauomyces humboldtii]|nr:hypothetical protein HKX48_004716 [Thoreauomyces humboldtii]